MTIIIIDTHCIFPAAEKTEAQRKELRTQWFIMSRQIHSVLRTTRSFIYFDKIIFRILVIASRWRRPQYKRRRRRRHSLTLEHTSIG